MDDNLDVYDVYDLYETRFHDQNNSTSILSNFVDSLHEINPFRVASFSCGLAMVTVACVGSAVNSMTAYVFSRPTMTSSISFLLTSLAIVDACLLITASPIFAANALLSYWQAFGWLNFVSYATVYLYPLASIFQTASVWILTLITVERFVAVCRPFAARTRCTRRRDRMALVAVLASSAAYNLVRFWDYSVYWISYPDFGSNGTLENYSVAVAWPELRDNEDYVRVYVHWLYFACIFALPFSTLLIFNALVVHTIRRARRDRLLLSRRQTKEHATAMMMTIVVLVFLVCDCLAFVLNALEVFGASVDQQDVNSISINFLPLPAGTLKPRHSHLFYFLIDANNLLIMTHCSLNFFIYYHFNQRFRLYVIIRFRYIARKCSRRWRKFCKKGSEDDQIEGDAVAALEEMGLELMRLQRAESSRTMISYLKRGSSREHQPDGRKHRFSTSHSSAFESSFDRRRASTAAVMTTRFGVKSDIRNHNLSGSKNFE